MYLTATSVHIYFLQSDNEEVKFANELWERIRRECKDNIHILNMLGCSYDTKSPNCAFTEYGTGLLDPILSPCSRSTFSRPVCIERPHLYAYADD